MILQLYARRYRESLCIMEPARRENSGILCPSPSSAMENPILCGNCTDRGLYCCFSSAHPALQPCASGSQRPVSAGANIKPGIAELNDIKNPHESLPLGLEAPDMRPITDHFCRSRWSIGRQAADATGLKRFAGVSAMSSSTCIISHRFLIDWLSALSWLRDIHFR